MSRWEGKIAVVTGASAGIGLAIAEAFVNRGMIVVGLARRKAIMEARMRFAQGNGKFIARECDVSKPENLKEVFHWIQSNLGVIQVMVNNAGVITSGTIVETSRQDWEKIFDVNVMGLLECTRHAVRVMKAANVEGHIVNINSIQGHRLRQIQNMSFNVYAASKHAVTAITATLQQELLGGKIRVTSISPGYVKTEILEAISDLDIDKLKVFSSFPTLESKDVAEAVVYVIETPQRVQITELTITPFGENM
ncbi:farnesol dehydrogenase [Harpegnathos saltator]|uniref:Dehydrogenase/reductase SDR family member 11 n=1 Tax=Harpegnathos saltator TaxID=610380 RepID=E2BY73_HARSA|nr:farnesol dehydrogenase [Harpegnathos saltator]XP_011147287.1 farnesol dehydrogenase [Harpegnathos saltator]EFN79352.1 Dehydrogenase/reductase SDR family member 11 [Harpegnathos saltator]